jgi:hypothetical protein
MRNYCPPDYFRDLRDERVAERPKSVHPSGNPMSHSTHVGFNEPLPSECLVYPGRLSVLPMPPVCFSPSDARAVGKCIFRPSKPFTGTLLQLSAEPSFQSRLVGVGHITCADSFGSPRLFSLPAFLSTASSLTGVCHNPDPVSPMRGANGASRYAFVAIYINSNNLGVIS